VTSNLLL